jgi:inner membrane protein
MLLWHLGIAALIVYVSLGRRRIDYRMILIGAVMPDLVDALLGLFLFEGDTGRWIAHSVFAAIGITVLIILVFRGDRRQSLFGIGVGWLLHLVADGMWQAPETFLWPAFGTTFSMVPTEPYSWDLFLDPIAHMTTWAGELIGLAILVWFWVAFRLGEADRFRLFLSDGYLRP